uniref:ATP synthase subunit a n=1 Tax=Scolytinae sp. BMNH 1274712 TaxID=1796543 RepID=A0A140EG41_9CUCU|nr:ATP synthase F0 subunit 6 [Scolytinae sp. BMNH 1274712]
MMANLFSTFDPTTGPFLSLNWSSAIIMIIMTPLSFWIIPSRINFIWTKITYTLHKEFKTLSSKNMKGSTLIFISLFTFIMINNIMGLTPHIFTSTSHLIMTLALALPLWLSFMIFGWINNTKSMLAHLVPSGTPPLLMPFMVCIETISNLIRPGTLAIRLTANMIAGHLLLTLLGNSGINLGLIMINGLIIIQLMLLTLEMAVAIIQSYVFTILSTLYSNEVN